MQNHGASLVDRAQADANQQVNQAYEETRRAQEVTEQCRAEAAQLIHKHKGKAGKR